MKYDAFISYRHGQLDGLVAAKLHKLIENYRIPGKIAKKIGKKRLKRVFRDRDELPTSSNLSQSIEDGIAESEFLLLICSRRLPLSQWCMREVELFSELHGKDRILALLIDGEPDEAFPPIISEREIDGEIIHVEPLAADIRAETWNKSLRLLSQEKLRLLAPILGVGYDDLKQRHRQRFIKRVIALASAAFVAVSAFAVFAQVQFARISQEMQYKLRNESLVLAEYSENALENGEVDTAIALALAGLPENLQDPERPYTASSEKSLVDALGWYDLSSGFKPFKTAESDTAPAALSISEDGLYSAVSFMYKTRIINNVTGLSVIDLQNVLSPVSDVVFLDNNSIIYTADDGVCAYDIVSETVLWKGETALFLSVSGDKQKIAASDGNTVWIYGRDGTELHKIKLEGQMFLPPEGAFSNPRNNIFALNETGTILALSENRDGMALVTLFSTDGSQSVVGYSEVSLNGRENIDYAQGSWLSDNIIAFSIYDTKSDPDYSKLMIFDLGSQQVLREFDNDAGNFVSKAYGGYIWFAIGNTVYRFDTADSFLEQIATSAANISDFAVTDNALIFADNAGYYYFDLNTKKQTRYTSDFRCDFVEVSGDYAVLAGLDWNTIRIMRKTDEDNYPVFTYPDADYEFSEARLSSDLSRLALYSADGIRIYGKDGTVLADIINDKSRNILDIQYINGKIAVIYSDGYAAYDETGAEVAAIDGASYVSYVGAGILCIKDGSAQLYNGKNLIDWDIINSIKNEVPTEQIKAARYTSDGALSIITGTPQGRGLIIKITDGAINTVGTIETNGVFEAFFPEDDVAAIAPRTGATTFYKVQTNAAEIITDISSDGFAANIEKIGEGKYIAHYISSDLTKYALLLGDNFEPIAEIKNYIDHDATNVFIAEGDGKIMTTPIHTLETAVSDARLLATPLAKEQREKYHISD
jgi:outer membrane lipoprotein-sorting protein